MAVKKPVFPEHKGKSKKLSKAKLKKLMHEQFGVAEAELVIVIDALTQAVMMKYTNEALEGKRGTTINPDEVITEVTKKVTALLGVVLSNYFTGGEDGQGESEEPADEGSDSEAGEQSS